MEDTVTCPVCDNESAYFDGVQYTCPDCEHKWPFHGLPKPKEQK
ncbi:MAG: PhnA Zinc-Ribbon [Mucilaginibacter sp.]|nr:PhnA Zinc-Ribbon [Mucilaginibacter sp.]